MNNSDDSNERPQNDRIYVRHSVDTIKVAADASNSRTANDERGTLRGQDCGEQYRL